ncbi:MAG: GyrI-like domain-containing protein [Anaerolineae bacterium]|nr:GyrI-like domain-containing protein [Anaerolineae bacterium]MCB9131662.1 GyrI-like domain-containing protein [Anaerolineales bacterium]HRW11140.1 GyrI-like domain-containing protein [Caldilineaceae bacterium]MCB0244968.1 GyrI-like domain-containing protein [Anaerolineae bacterium]MCB9141791.1 GyrI-like domain-containing protein [Anaerolineales bacterium]
MTHQFELRERQSQPTLVIRTRSAVQDMPQVLGQAWGAIMHYAGQKGLQPSGPPFVAYHNMDMQDLDLEIGFPFAKKLDGAGEVLAGEIPGGKAAGCLHVGPYDQLRAAYKALGKWMEANGYTPAGVAYESYLNDPQTTPPEALQTDIFFPLL